MTVLSTLNNHKGKIIVGTGLVAGLCFYFRDYYDVVCSVYELFTAEQPGDLPAVVSPERLERYRKTIALADEAALIQTKSTCKSIIANLYSTQIECLQRTLKSKESYESSKTVAFTELQNLCFSRTVTAATMSVLISLSVRVESCVFSREPSSEGRDPREEVLAACDPSADEALIADLDAAIRTLVTRKLGDFSPNHKLFSAEYQRILKSMFCEIPSYTSRILAVPTSLDSPQARELASHLSSPQWRASLTASLAAVGEALGGRTAGEGEFALATRMGLMKKEFDRSEFGVVSSEDLTWSIFGINEPEDFGPSEKDLLAMIEKMAASA